MVYRWNNGSDRGRGVRRVRVQIRVQFYSLMWKSYRENGSHGSYVGPRTPLRILPHPKSPPTSLPTWPWSLSRKIDWGGVHTRRFGRCFRWPKDEIFWSMVSADPVSETFSHEDSLLVNLSPVIVYNGVRTPFSFVIEYRTGRLPEGQNPE